VGQAGKASRSQQLRSPDNRLAEQSTVRSAEKIIREPQWLKCSFPGRNSPMRLSKVQGSDACQPARPKKAFGEIPRHRVTMGLTAAPLNSETMYR
jgi:hypothetical protein